MRAEIRPDGSLLLIAGNSLEHYALIQMKKKKPQYAIVYDFEQYKDTGEDVVVEDIERDE